MKSIQGESLFKQRLKTSKLFNAAMLSVLLLSACGQKSAEHVAASMAFSDEVAQTPVASAEQRESDAAKQYLAYTHDFSVALPSTQVQPVYEQLLEACNTDQQHGCLVVQARLSSNNFSRASLQLRVQSAGIAPLLKLIASQGQVINQSTSAEDLSNAVVDNEKRIDMLLNYRNRLQTLEMQKSSDIETLMKNASELATVQSDIEYAQGAKRNLLQRIKKDFLNIELSANHPQTQQSFWQPIAQAFDGLGYDIGQGISYLLTFLVYAVFWVPAIFIFLLVLRIFWRFIFKRGKAS